MSTPIPLGTGAAPAGRPDPAAAWRRRAVWHRRTALLPLGYLAAAVAVGGLAAAGFHVHWLLLHIVLLGAVSNAIVVWSAHFSAAILRAPAAERRLAEAIRLGALNVGILAVLIGGSLGPVWLGIGGAAVVFAAIAAHLAGLAAMARRALPARFRVVVWYYLVAGVALLTGIPAGAWMLAVPANRRPRVLLFHVQVNVLGWVMLTVLGTLLTLWPTVLRTQITEGAARDARRGLIACTAGLAVLAAGMVWWLRPLAAAGLAILAAGVLVALRPMVPEARRRRPASFAALSLAAGTLWLLITLGWDGWALLTASGPAAAAGRFGLLAVAMAAGFAGQVLIGALGYLLPTALGGGPSAVRQNMASLDRYPRWRVAAFNVGLVALLWLPGGAVRVAGVALVSAAAAAFVIPAAVLALRARRAGASAA